MLLACLTERGEGVQKRRGPRPLRRSGCRVSQFDRVHGANPRSFLVSISSHPLLACLLLSCTCTWQPKPWGYPTSHTCGTSHTLSHTLIYLSLRARERWIDLVEKIP